MSSGPEEKLRQTIQSGVKWSCFNDKVDTFHSDMEAANEAKVPLGCALYQCYTRHEKNTVKGIEELEALRDGGDKEAAFSLACVRWVDIAPDSQPATNDKEKMEEILLRLVEEKYEPAEGLVADLILKGKLERDAPDGFDVVGALERAKAVGFLPATLSLGEVYEEGKLVEKDPERAFKLYEEAVKVGDQEAQINLGKALFYGVGCEEDKERGREVLEKGKEAMYLPDEFMYEFESDDDEEGEDDEGEDEE